MVAYVIYSLGKVCDEEELKKSRQVNRMIQPGREGEVGKLAVVSEMKGRLIYSAVLLSRAV